MRFADITVQSGVDMITTCGELPTTHILEVNGSGLALIDFDNDGLLDLFVANGATIADPENGPGCRLYKNLGELRFADVTEAARIDVKRWAMGATVGDYDGDGFDDIYICCYGPNILLRNMGDGTFRDVTEQAFGQTSKRQNVKTSKESGEAAPQDVDVSTFGRFDVSEWSSSAAFGDFNNDGRLDLYVVNYLQFDHRNPPRSAMYKGVPVMAGPHGLTPQHDVLYQNEGGGKFSDVTAEAGCLPPQPAYGLNLIVADFDDDGWQDIVVANDSMPDFYFRNKGIEASRHQGIEADSALDASMPHHASMPIFEEIGVISGIASNADGGNQASMGIGIADVDGNGRPDKFTTVFSSDTNTLHLNVDGRFFEDRTQAFGLGMISRPYLGWACAFYDFDHDGDEDLMMFNGHVYPQATVATMDSEYQQPPLLFEREGRRFVRVSAEKSGPWLARASRDRAAVWGDLDHDGDIDVIVAELNGPIRVLRNETVPRLSEPGVRTGAPPDPTDWLIVELKDDRPGATNHRGLGARIELLLDEVTPAGKAGSFPGSESRATSTRWLFTGGGFQSSSQHAAHFAIPAGAQLKALRIKWPDGHVQEIQSPKPGRNIVRRD